MERDDDRARAEALQSCGAVEGKRNDRVIDGHRGDRQLRHLRVPNLDPDLARSELDAPDVELICGRRVPADQVDDRRSTRNEPADRDREQQDRYEHPRSSRSAAMRDGTGRHQSTTSK